MFSRIFGQSYPQHQCTNCGHVEEPQMQQTQNTTAVSTLTRDPLWGWFDNHIGRMEEDLMRQSSALMEHPVFPMMGAVFDPVRRQRMFDTLFESPAGLGPASSRILKHKSWSVN